MMRRCKLEFLIFFNLAILKQQKKKKSWSGQDGKSTEQLLINGGDSQLFMGVIPNISHWQGQVFPPSISLFLPCTPFSYCLIDHIPLPNLTYQMSHGHLQKPQRSEAALGL